MVIVDGIESNATIKKIQEDIAKEPTDDEVVEHLIKEGEGDLVMQDVEFTKPNGKKRRGFYMDGWLKQNLDNYLIKGVQKKWDGVVLISGIEGSSKSTNAMAIAKYVDPTFSGEPLNDGTGRRKCDRVVFSAEDFMKQIDNVKPGQAIVFDEAVFGFASSDANSDMQKILVKKMVTIRKKRLFLFIVIPSIFLLRMYMSVFRTRALIHFYSPDGLSRGYFKFYSFDKKRQLYIQGKKDFNQNAVEPDFKGRATDTTGFFFNMDEYEDKKDEAIRQLTDAPLQKKKKEGKLQIRFKGQRDLLIYHLYNENLQKNKTWTYKDQSEQLTEFFGEKMKFTPEMVSVSLENGLKYLKSEGIHDANQSMQEKIQRLQDNYTY